MILQEQSSLSALSSDIDMPVYSANPVTGPRQQGKGIYCHQYVILGRCADLAVIADVMRIVRVALYSTDSRRATLHRSQATQ